MHTFQDRILRIYLGNLAPMTLTDHIRNNNFKTCHTPKNFRFHWPDSLSKTFIILSPNKKSSTAENRVGQFNSTTPDVYSQRIIMGKNSWITFGKWQHLKSGKRSVCFLSFLSCSKLATTLTSWLLYLAPGTTNNTRRCRVISPSFCPPSSWSCCWHCFPWLAGRASCRWRRASGRPTCRPWRRRRRGSRTAGTGRGCRAGWTTAGSRWRRWPLRSRWRRAAPESAPSAPAKTRSTPSHSPWIRCRKDQKSCERVNGDSVLKLWVSFRFNYFCTRMASTRFFRARQVILKMVGVGAVTDVSQHITSRNQWYLNYTDNKNGKYTAEYALVERFVLSWGVYFFSFCFYYGQISHYSRR